ncbi:MAG: efflux RND transporter periplasmic adaptor subunit [Bacillota bacterium]
MTRRVLGAILVVALVFVGGIYVYDILIGDAEGEADPVYATEVVSRGDLNFVVNGHGNLRPRWSESIQTVAGGFVEELNVKEGDEVSEGDIVGRLRNEQLDTEVRTMERELERIESDLAMTLGTSRDAILDADPERGISIFAPISGRVTDLRVEAEDSLEGGGVVATIVDDSRVMIKAEFNTAQFELVEEGDVVDLRPLDFADILLGEIVDANPSPIPRGEHYVYEVTVEAENPGLLRPGQEIDVLIGEETSVRATVDRYNDETSVWSSTEGTVLEVPAREWEYVEEGDVLCRLGGNATARYIFDHQVEITELREELEEKKKERDRLVVRSPIDGTVAKVMASEGQRLEPGAHITAVIDNSKMTMTVELDELDVIQVEPGMEAEVTVEALPGEVFGAQITSVDMMGSDEEGRAVYNTQIQVSGTNGVRPGMTGNAAIAIEELVDVLLVPVEAVYQDEGEARVDLLSEGEAEPRTIEIGLVSSSWVEVKDGLEEGEEVITGRSEDRLEHEVPGEPESPIIPSPESPEEESPAEVPEEPKPQPKEPESSEKPIEDGG